MHQPQDFWQVDGDLDQLAQLAQLEQSTEQGQLTQQGQPREVSEANDVIEATDPTNTHPADPIANTQPAYGPTHGPIHRQPHGQTARPSSKADQQPDQTARPPSTAQIVEALLFVGGTPLTAQRACEIVRGLTVEQFRHIIDDLNRLFRRQNRPYTIQSTDQGWVMVLRRRYARLRERLNGSPRAIRLTGAAMDVLAIVAYRQPISKRDVDTMRGQESGAVLRNLVRLGLIGVSSRGDSNRETSYHTTKRFLEVFGLKKLADLPQIGDFSRL